MTDVQRDVLFQHNGTKESPFFDQNVGETDILTNIVIPVIFIVIGKFSTNNQYKSDRPPIWDRLPSQR